MKSEAPKKGKGKAKRVTVDEADLERKLREARRKGYVEGLVRARSVVKDMGVVRGVGMTHRKPPMAGAGFGLASKAYVRTPSGGSHTFMGWFDTGSPTENRDLSRTWCDGAYNMLEATVYALDTTAAIAAADREMRNDSD